MKIKTILVTGGTGLVGNAINDISKDYIYNFIFLDSKMCDLKNYKETKELFDFLNPDYVIHLAACVGGLYKNMNEPIKMMNDNLLINTNVLTCASEIKVERLIACLSTCIFPDDVTYPIDETMLHDGPPHPSNECYAYAKRILEVQCRYYKKQGLNFSCIIPTNIYGPHDNFDLQDSHVIPGLIHRCYLAKERGKPFIVRGTGKPLRQFIYSIDLARIIMEMVVMNNSENMIISPNTEYSIKEIADLIAYNFNYNNVIYDDTYSDGQYRKTVDNSKLLDFCNFEFTTMDAGIKNTVDWFKSNYDTARK